MPTKAGYSGVWQPYTEAIHSDVTIQAAYTVIQHTVTFVADGTTVKTMTVNDGYTLTDSDYPTVPTKAGYSGAWQQYTEAIHADITIQATYTALAQYTVKFVADGVTVKTMTVYEGYVLKTADYPTVPEKAGYSGSWRRRTTAITSDVTIQAVYTVIQHNVKFVVLRRTVKTLTVSDGYILHSGDYPTLPDGYGWTRNTDPIHSDITVTAIEGTSKPLVTFTGNGVTAKIMAVNRGYKLKDSDYPSVPEKKGYLGTWTKYTDAIYEDITITATYKRSEIIKPPIRPTGAVASEDLPEPIEPQDVIKPEDNAETLSNRPNQTLVSTQTVTHEYLTLSGKVARETVKKNGSVTDVMDFVYDESGRPFALIHQTDGVGITLCTYYYVLNLQGDVVKLVTASGDVVANYEYDAWGNILSQSGEMASINPLRYRGYYYDNETGFYYLQSRYYDPTMRRFINADTYASTGQGFIGANMFAYCNNNPVRYLDSRGLDCVPATPWDEAYFERFLEEYDKVTDGEPYEYPVDGATYTVKIETEKHVHRERLISDGVGIGISGGEIIIGGIVDHYETSGEHLALLSQGHSLLTSLPFSALAWIVTSIDSASEDPLMTDTYTKYTIEYTYQETLKRPTYVDRYLNVTVNSRDVFVLYVSHKKDGSVKHSWSYGQRFKTEVS